MDEYWNHNTAFHPEILAAVRPGSRVLDVGCGDGLLMSRIAVTGARVTGIDSDPVAVRRARTRLAGFPNTTVLLGDVLDAPGLDGRRFDLVTCVAVLHHLPPAPALRRMGDLLEPGGELRVVGLAGNRTAFDWAVSAALLVPIRVASWLHRESGYPGMRTAEAVLDVAEIRRVAADVLAGSRVRRRFYYRYTLTWTKPRGR